MHSHKYKEHLMNIKSSLLTVIISIGFCALSPVVAQEGNENDSEPEIIIEGTGENTSNTDSDTEPPSFSLGIGSSLGTNLLGGISLVFDPLDVPVDLKVSGSWGWGINNLNLQIAYNFAQNEFAHGYAFVEGGMREVFYGEYDDEGNYVDGNYFSPYAHAGVGAKILINHSDDGVIRGYAPNVQVGLGIRENEFVGAYDFVTTFSVGYHIYLNF